MTLQNSAEKREKLLKWFGDYDNCVVAFSGGVDSSVLAKAAVCALGDRAVAVYLESETSLKDERAFAEKIAKEIGISLTVMAGEEFGDPDFIKNTPERCYFCKKIRFSQLSKWAELRRIGVMVEGSNADDRNDFRPGSRAAGEIGVRAPLAEVGLTKAEIRELAGQWGLSNQNKPATPCLATRIAYNLEITPQRLETIEAAESFLASLGLTSVRVRLHEANLVRIEVEASQISRFVDNEFREKVTTKFLSLEFGYISLDLTGFRSGSINAF